MEVIFEVRDADEGGSYARALGSSIFTQADSWDDLRANVVKAVSLHFEDAVTRPRLVQMHTIRLRRARATQYLPKWPSAIHHDRADR